MPPQMRASSTCAAASEKRSNVRVKPGYPGALRVKVCSSTNNSASVFTFMLLSPQARDDRLDVAEISQIRAWCRGPLVAVKLFRRLPMMGLHMPIGKGKVSTLVVPVCWQLGPDVLTTRVVGTVLL